MLSDHCSLSRSFLGGRLGLGLLALLLLVLGVSNSLLDTLDLLNKESTHDSIITYKLIKRSKQFLLSLPGADVTTSEDTTVGSRNGASTGGESFEGSWSSNLNTGHS